MTPETDNALVDVCEEMSLHQKYVPQERMKRLVSIARRGLECKEAPQLEQTPGPLEGEPCHEQPIRDAYDPQPEKVEGLNDADIVWMETVELTLHPLGQSHFPLTDWTTKKMVRQAAATIRAKDEKIEKLTLNRDWATSRMLQNEEDSKLHYDCAESAEARVKELENGIRNVILGLYEMKAGGGAGKNHFVTYDFPICNEVIERLNELITAALTPKEKS